MPVARRSSMAFSASRCVLECEALADDGLDEARLGQAVDLGADLLVELGLAQREGTPAGAHDLGVVEQQAVDPHLRDGAAGEADHDRAPTLAQRAQAVGEAIAADRVEDHVDPARRRAPWPRPSTPRRSARPRRRRPRARPAPWRRSTRRRWSSPRAPLAICSDAVPTPPAAPWTRTVSPSLQAPADLQREVGGVVVEDQPRALREVQRVGEREGQPRRRYGHLGEAAEHAERGDAVAGREARAVRRAAHHAGTSLPGTKGSAA